MFTQLLINLWHFSGHEVYGKSSILALIKQGQQPTGSSCKCGTPFVPEKVSF
jgi:hypothetical protein